MKIVISETEDECDYEECDSKLMQIEQIITAKRELLLRKQQQIHKMSKTNNFLEEIKDDYQNYYSYIAKQKEDQVTALSILNKYIDDLASSGELSKHNIKDAKIEQRKIMKEISSIKSKLKNLMGDIGSADQNK